MLDIFVYPGNESANQAFRLFLDIPKSVCATIRKQSLAFVLVKIESARHLKFTLCGSSDPFSVISSVILGALAVSDGVPTPEKSHAEIRNKKARRIAAIQKMNVIFLIAVCLPCCFS